MHVSCNRLKGEKRVLNNKTDLLKGFEKGNGKLKSSMEPYYFLISHYIESEKGFTLLHYYGFFGFILVINEVFLEMRLFLRGG